MRNLFARVIDAIARALTFPFFGSERRLDVLHRVSDKLAGRCTIEIRTDEGCLLLGNRGHPDAINFPAEEPDTVDWLQSHPEGSVLWDIGANIGFVALFANLRRTQVLAFEPAARSYGELNRNIELNSAAYVKAYCVAFAEETAIDTLHMAATTPGSSTHEFGTTVNQFGQDINVNFCQGAIGFSIDDFVKIFSPPLPTHVKIDVDGIEAGILRGGRMTLSSPSVSSMIVEIEGDLSSVHNRTILDLMAEFGFIARPKASPHLRNVIFDRRST